tara:strand:- start:92 stop:514 length:423 start_codon:yes stop_codon:yes gene_type:complete
VHLVKDCINPAQLIDVLDCPGAGARTALLVFHQRLKQAFAHFTPQCGHSKPLLATWPVIWPALLKLTLLLNKNAIGHDVGHFQNLASKVKIIRKNVQKSWPTPILICPGHLASPVGQLRKSLGKVPHLAYDSVGQAKWPL